jgi:hypothetical protein
MWRGTTLVPPYSAREQAPDSVHGVNLESAPLQIECGICTP